MARRMSGWTRWLAAWLVAMPLAAAAMPFESIAPGLELLRGRFVPGQQPDGNTVLLRGARGWIVVDTGRYEAHAQAILRHVSASGLPITDIVNTHWHLDHVSGNALLRRAYPEAEVHASQAIRDAMHGFLADYREQLSAMAAQHPDSPDRPNWLAEMARIDLGAQLHPTRPVVDTGRRRMAGRDLDLHLVIDAVTDADVWVYDRASRTVLAGDLVTLPVPFLDTACPAGWRKALTVLDDQRFARLVPGHGPVMDRRQFRRYREAFGRLVDCAGQPERAVADCAEGWVRDLGDLLAPADQARTRELLDYYVERRLRGPGATADCGPLASR